MLNNKVYEVLKWAVLVCIPVLTTAYVSLAALWGWPVPEAVAETSAILCAMIGSLLGISTAEYRRKQ